MMLELIKKNHFFAKVNISLLLCLFITSGEVNAQEKNMSTTQANILIDAKADLGEGALWQPLQEKLYWVDIEKKNFHIYNPLTDSDKKFFVEDRVSAVVPTPDGNALLALQNGVHKINIKTGDLSFITNPIKDSNIRFNDGKCDPAGRFWVGTMAFDGEKGAGTLYRMDKDLSIHAVLNNVSVSNGIVWTSSKKKMYYVDTPTSTVQVFDYHNNTGVISKGKVVIRIPLHMGVPDGMTIDSDDNLWIALWGGGTVAKYNPRSGKLLKKIVVPAPHTTSCAFGGKNLETLYITTARQGLSDKQLKKFPLSGGVFSIIPGAKGVPTNFCKIELSD